MLFRSILDAGCGEGSFLSAIVHQQSDFLGIGIDIAKEGIMQTEPTKQSIFLVGDLAKLPIQSNSIDVILNILTPAHYTEFARVLKEGIVIKVIPNSNYLRELRKVCYADSDKQSYSNHQTVQHFYNNFQCVEEKDCYYQFSVTQETLDHILHMTPLTWNLSQKSDVLALRNIESITCDFKILIGYSIWEN